MNDTQFIPEKTKKKPSKFALGAFEVFESFVCAAIVVLIVLTFFFKICIVEGSSMNKTLYEGEKPLIILDDPFTAFDDGKTEAALKLMREFAKDRQVIYFTCSSSRSI